MADFQSTLTAQEIEKVLTGAVLFNSNTKLSEAQKAQARANIGATSYGEGIKIVSHFDTLAELEAAVAEPKPSDAYSVGSKLPYNLYIYDGLASEWKDYGAIRSTDISARFAQNKSVAVADWEEDTNVFEDYSYKAQIPIGEVTGNDFPIVVFSPFDATCGNFCPMAYSFDGCVEVWAKTKPTATISIPAITFIVQEEGATGNSTKGITNACGGTPTGGVTTAMLANGSLTTPKYANASVTRAKLANDALYSPFNALGASYSIVATDMGKTLRGAWNADTDITLSQSVSTTLPIGFEFAVLRYGSSSSAMTQLIADGVKFLVLGATSTMKNVTLQIPETFGMIALKKCTTEAAGDCWLVTGNVEVVS